MESTTQQPYLVNLDVFEGPLDLLLYLIRKNDLDVYDIPIAFITEEYLKYLNVMKELNIDAAGEFLLMASELMYIKSKMLIPSSPEEGEVEEDPRRDLANRLLEYQRYKEAALELVKRPILFQDVYARYASKTDADGVVLEEGNVFQLLEAFAIVVARLPKESAEEISVDRISVSERIFELIDIIKLNKTVSLDDLLLADSTRYDVVITFLALLEMVRLKMIKTYQAGRYEKIYVTGVMEIENPNIKLQTSNLKINPNNQIPKL